MAVEKEPLGEVCNFSSGGNRSPVQAGEIRMMFAEKVKRCCLLGGLLMPVRWSVGRYCDAGDTLPLPNVPRGHYPLC